MNHKIFPSNHYYPFGMLMPTRTWDAESSYRFGFNTQERVDEISGKGNHNTALYWEYDTRLGRRWNLDPKPNAAISSYASLGNNPIMLNDILGDSVNLGNLYDIDESGNFKNETEAKAFETFAATPEGEKYIRDRAQSGFHFQGKFNKDLNITVNQGGVLNKQGIDVNFNVAEMDNSSAAGETGFTITNNRLKLNILLENSKSTPTAQNVFNTAETIGHETFYHGNIYEQRFLSISPNLRTTNNVYSKESYLHTFPIDKTDYYKVGVGYLQNVQKVLNLPINTPEYLYYNVMLPSFGYGYKLRPDIKK